MSSLALGPTFVVDGPLPVKPKFDLLAAAQEGSTADVKDDGTTPPMPRFGPFTVYLPAICTTFDSRPDDEFRDRLMTAFEAKEGYGVAKQLASGAGNPLNPFLGDSNRQLLNSGGATGYIEALSLLENAIAATAQGGMIHATPAVATSWAAYDLIEADGVGEAAIMRTELGTPIAISGGYIGTHVSGAAAPGDTTEWAYATGPVAIRRDVAGIVAGSLKESLDRHINEVVERAERPYLVVWDTALQAAVLVNRAVTN